MIDWTKAKYSTLDECWLLNLDKEDIQGISPNKLQIVITGNQEKCESSYFPLIEKVALQLPSLLIEAEHYLKFFVNFANIKSSTGKVCVQSIDFGTWERAAKNEFQMTLLMHQDDYGFWLVRFHYSEQLRPGFWPYYFARCQQ